MRILSSSRLSPPEFVQPKKVSALHHVRRMRGSSQSHLMLCSDGNMYVVKFRNNPQHGRVLCNEMLGTCLARCVGLPVPAFAIVDVKESLIRNNPALSVGLPGNAISAEPGLQFGSRHVLANLHGEAFDLFPSKALHRVRNLRAFAGAWLFDRWVCNGDARQAVFWKHNWSQQYTVVFIDQGNCFGADNWGMPEHLLRGVYSNLEVYRNIKHGQQFSPWLARILEFAPAAIREICNAIPPQWYDGEKRELQELVERLAERRTRVSRDLQACGEFPLSLFQRWCGNLDHPLESVHAK